MIAFKRHKPPAGARPGEFHIPSGAHFPEISEYLYSADSFSERSIYKVEEIAAEIPADSVMWVDVQGLGDAAMLHALAARFNIHPLALADVVNVPQRPKSEEYEHHHLFILRMARLEDDEDAPRSRGRESEVGMRTIEDRLDVEQVSVIVGKNFVITFQERHGDVLDPIRQRIRMATGRIRAAGADYLAYALIDTIVDGFFPVIEAVSDEIEELEDEVLANPSARHPEEIHRIKTLLQHIRRALWPTRDMLSSATRDLNPYIQDSTRLYFRDALDHAMQLSEVLDSQKETAIGLMNTYLSVMSNRTNEVMKVLTVITTIFIPLSFLAGIYGMNFENMPELHARWGYPGLWLIMIVIALLLGWYFRRKGWFESDS